MVKIALLHKQTPTLISGNYLLRLAKRLFGSKMRNGKKDVEEIIGQLSKSISQNSPDILIGPEYLFCNPNRLYTPKEKTELIRCLEEITENSSTLLVPGTIVWRNGSIYANTAPVIYHGKTIREIEKLSARGIDVGFCGNGVQCIDHSELKSRYAAGHIFQEYIKNHMVTVDGKNYLIEICDDHSYIAENQSLSIPKTVDYQIIVSCEHYDHFETDPGRLFLREGGLLIECNGEKPTSFVAALKKKELQPLHTSESPAAEGIEYISK